MTVWSDEKSSVPNHCFFSSPKWNKGHRTNFFFCGILILRWEEYYYEKRKTISRKNGYEITLQYVYLLNNKNIFMRTFKEKADDWHYTWPSPFYSIYRDLNIYEWCEYFYMLWILLIKKETVLGLPKTELR